MNPNIFLLLSLSVVGFAAAYSEPYYPSEELCGESDVSDGQKTPYPVVLEYKGHGSDDNTDWDIPVSDSETEDSPYPAVLEYKGHGSSDSGQAFIVSDFETEDSSESSMPSAPKLRRPKNKCRPAPPSAEYPSSPSFKECGPKRYCKPNKETVPGTKYAPGQSVKMRRKKKKYPKRPCPSFTTTTTKSPLGCPRYYSSGDPSKNKMKGDINNKNTINTGTTAGDQGNYRPRGYYPHGRPIGNDYNPSGGHRYYDYNPSGGHRYYDYYRPGRPIDDDYYQSGGDKYDYYSQPGKDPSKNRMKGDINNENTMNSGTIFGDQGNNPNGRPIGNDKNPSGRHGYYDYYRPGRPMDYDYYQSGGDKYDYYYQSGGDKYDYYSQPGSHYDDSYYGTPEHTRLPSGIHTEDSDDSQGDRVVRETLNKNIRAADFYTRPDWKKMWNITKRDHKQ